MSLMAFLMSAGALAAEPDQNPPPLTVKLFDTTALPPSIAAVANGSLDSQFGAFDLPKARGATEIFWLRLHSAEGFRPAAAPALIVRKGRHLHTQLFTRSDTNGAGEIIPLHRAMELPDFRAMHDVVYVLPHGLAAGQSLYARVEAMGTGAEELSFALATLDETMEHGTVHARMIALAFGALMAMSLTALLIWFVLRDKLLILYAALFAMQALYIAYLSGQGFEWPILSWALPLQSHAWNVPVALGGVMACLFVREIADLKRFSPRVYNAFGWLAIAFGVLTFANLGRLIGLGAAVAAIGNVLFLFACVFTLIVAYNAWRRNNRAAGYFLIAWGLLEAFSIATALRLLVTDAENSEGLLYYGLPLSMVAAAILVALGVSDKLREQRIALTDAERRAQTDPLTGVLNRRSLVERLEAACSRARTRGLPIALLFIDLDHFKKINDSYGHPAGDACLAAVIDPIQAELRQSDVIGRYGGEEFVVILSSADTAAAHLIAERILKRVAEVRVEGFGDPIHLTCSIGVAASDTLGVWGEHLIAQADSAVYAAKRSGRNQVQIATTLAA